MSNVDERRSHERSEAGTAASGHAFLGNQLLALLERGEHELLKPHLETVSLPLGVVLYEPGAPITHAYFPTGSLISLVNVVADGAVEVGIVGRDGWLGVPALLLTDSMPWRSVVQVGGSAERIDAGILSAVVQENRDIARPLLRYAQALSEQVGQSAACNALHTVEQRLSRWLLATADRIDDGELPITQQFLSQMLGVHRPAVSVAATALQRNGLIHYVRGRVTIIDRAGLERSSCACYEATRRSSERLLGFRPQKAAIRTS